MPSKTANIVLRLLLLFEEELLYISVISASHIFGTGKQSQSVEKSGMIILLTLLILIGWLINIFKQHVLI